jgi:hypothetical protein
MSAFMSGAVPVFDIRVAAGGPSDMLVRSSALGAAMAQTLGARPVALMRGHGAIAVGPSLPHAVFRSVYTEMNARLQAQAMALGAPIMYLDPRRRSARRSPSTPRWAGPGSSGAARRWGAEERGSPAWSGFRSDERLHGVERRTIGGRVGAKRSTPEHAGIVEAERLPGVPVHDVALGALLPEASAGILLAGIVARRRRLAEAAPHRIDIGQRGRDRRPSPETTGSGDRSPPRRRCTR